ncbi:hypothetical protein CSB09_00225 [Candidatus Gracilibacteria bacterium]|nr:MAG: hypothetical protein CSB09_00225 [Candidatus Gracilibacteria bacterium]
MKHKNIIYITGDDSFGIERELNGLISIFEKKYGNINIEKIALENAHKIHESLFLSLGLFSEKRLFIIRGSQSSKNTKKKEVPGLESVLENIHGTLSEDTILIFAFLPKTEKKLENWLKKHASLREKKFSWLPSAWTPRTTLDAKYVANILSLYKKYESLRDNYNPNPWIAHEIMHTIEMAEILNDSGTTLDMPTIEKLIHAYQGGHLFQFIDSILAGNIQASIKKLQAFYHHDSIYPFLAGLVSSLRNSLYVITLRDLGKSVQYIAEHLSMHSNPRTNAFLIQKSYKSSLSQKEISNFYQKIISKKILYQSGFGMKKSELGILFEIELALLNLKK